MKIIIGNNASKKIKNFIDLTKGEISGLGKSHVEDGNIIVDDVVLLKQVCTGTTTKLNEDAMMEFLNELIISNEPIEQWNVWWHSHANFGVFWSGEDNNTIEGHIGKCSHLVSIVGNKKEEYLGRLDVFPKDTSGFNIPIFHTTNLTVEHEVENDIEIFFNDLTKDKQKEYIHLVSTEVANNTEPLTVFTPQRESEDLLIFEHCTNEVSSKVKENTYIPYNRNSTKQLINTYDKYNLPIKESYKKPITDIYGRPISDKRYKKMVNKYGIDIDKYVLEEDYLLPSHKTTFELDGLENINKKYNIDTTNK